MRFRKLFGDLLIMTRAERNGVVVLLFLIVLAMLFRFMIPALQQKDQDYLKSIDQKISQMEAQKDSIAQSRQELRETAFKKEEAPLRIAASYFYFNPNTLPYDSLLMLGIPSRTAQNLIKFREKGGKFYQAGDLMKIYGLEASLFKRLETWIRIPAEADKPYVEKNLTIREAHNTTTPKVEKLEINQADSAAWTTLPGIGPVYARRICNFRYALGGFVRFEQLKEVYKFPTETYDFILPHLVLDTSLVRTINLNFADAGELMRHPYCDVETAKRIVAYRSENGPYASVSILLSDSLMSPESYHKISAYLRVNP